MTGYQKKRLLLFLACSIFIRAGLMAQDENHCVARKSPKKMAVESGLLIYQSQCVSCHREDGSGNAAVKVSLVNSALVTGNKKALIEYLVNGKSPADGGDRQTASHIMMGNPETTNEEISNVLTYVRHRFGNKSSMVKINEVKAVRGE
jgi:mono/diheme cytochrome c family protein